MTRKNDGRWRHLLVAMAGLLVVGVAVALFGQELERHISALEAWVAHLGWPGMVAFALIVALALCLLMPETLFSVAAGVIFGVWWGVAIMLIANVLAGALQYGLAYRLFQEPVRRRLGAGKMAGMIERVAHGNSLRMQALLRLAPVNQAVVGYLLGASSVRFSQYMAALIGLLPVIIFEVYLGHTGKHLAMLGAGIKHAGWQHNLLILVGLLVVVVAVGFASRWAYRALNTPTGRPE